MRTGQTQRRKIKAGQVLARPVEAVQRELDLGQAGERTIERFEQAAHGCADVERGTNTRTGVVIGVEIMACSILELEGAAQAARLDRRLAIGQQLVEALAEAGLAVFHYQAKEALALINGTQLMCAVGGLALARGELIQFLDADDLLHPQKLERQVRLSLEDPKAIVYCDYVVQDIDSGQVLEIPKRECEGLDPVVFAIRAERLQTSAPLHRKAALLEIGGFDESLPCAQEYDLHIRLACHGYRWRHLREVLYTLRRRKNSVSSDYARVINIHPRIMRRAREILVEPNEWTEIRAEEMAGKLAHGARVLLRLNRVSEARRLETEAAAFHWSAGLRLAYSSIGRLLRRLIGPVKTEKLREWAKWARVVA